MTDDDGFVFGDDSDDETGLFGASSAESDADTATTDRRFGTTTSDDTDSRSFVRRVRKRVSGGRVRTAATAGLAVVLVVALGLVAYPLVMGALDGAGPAGENVPTTGTPSIETHATATTETPTSAAVTTVTTNVRTDVPTTTAPANRTAIASSTVRKTPNATPTPIPTRSFPAGTPAETNETTGSVRSVQSAA